MPHLSLSPLHLSWMCLALACGREAPGPSATDRWDGVARVNGQVIGEAEVRARVKTRLHPEALSGADLRNLVQPVVEQELLAQHALALGLDKDPDYRKRLQEREAELAQWRRRELSALAERRLAASAAPTDEEVRAELARRPERFAHELHVEQILVRSSAEAEAARAALTAGEPFERVAERVHPTPQGQPPSWDLGWLAWRQVPDAWGEAIWALAPGQVSELIAGPRERFWILRVAGRRPRAASCREAVGEACLFELDGPAIRDRLREAKLQEARRTTLEALRARARIDLSPGTGGG